MRWKAVAFSGILTLGGCAGSEAPDPAVPIPPVLKNTRPEHVADCNKIKPVEYSASVQKQAATELKILAITSQTATFIVDYGRLRKAIREECKL